jgi:hypothetical protein
MKYLHSGYILFCDRAEHAEDGRINALGLFDLCTGNNLPLRMSCNCIIGFGTPYERRQYKGLLTIEGPDGHELVSHEFSANEPGEMLQGHYIYKLDINILQEGSYTARAILSNWKNENVWEVSRDFWAMVAQDGPPDP